ncbi:member of major facilitator superfamily multidrug-resistance, DHA1 sub-family [Amanita muscaria]
MTDRPDEETPLLHHAQPKKTPLPWFQFSIVMFLQLAEPLTSQVIYPFTPELIRNIGITNGDETKVGYYVGMMQSIFFLTQAFTVLHWSRISDIVGRKPVILTGLFGLSVSMYLFGLSRTFWALVLSRSLNGALNGNIGVIKSMMAELTDETNISTAYAYMPIAWSTGGTLGPIIGGSLSRPAEQFPHLFGNNEFLKKYPYFLPCAVPATFTAVAWLVTFFFLKETVKHTVPVSHLIKRRNTKIVDADAQSSKDIPEHEKPLPLRSLLIWRVIIAGANYASLSFIDIAFRAIQPVFFSTPIELGGLGLSPAAIGNVLSIFGLWNGVFQLFFFTRIIDRLGAKATFIVGIAASFPVFASFPIMNYLARQEGYSLSLWIAVGFQLVCGVLIGLSYGAIFIFVQGSSPNRASLGATNGLCQMTVSLMRALGPAMANSLFSLSMDKGYLGGYLVYYILMGVVGMSLYVALLLPKRVWS